VWNVYDEKEHKFIFVQIFFLQINISQIFLSETSISLIHKISYYFGLCIKNYGTSTQKSSVFHFL